MLLRKNTEKTPIKFCCTNCEKIFEKTPQKCKICNSNVCVECTMEGDIIWLVGYRKGLSNKCVGCEKIGCSKCMKFPSYKKSEMLCKKCR